MEFYIPGQVIDSEGGSARLWAAWPYEQDDPGIITSEYGEYGWRASFDHDSDPTTPPKDMGPHKGQDIAHPSRALSPLNAVMDGEVLFNKQSSISPGGGIKVILDHDGRGYDGWTSHYLHTDRVRVQVGQQVSAGDEVALEGATGYVTGRHVHFAVRNPELAAELGTDARMRGYLDPESFLTMGPPPTPPFSPMPVSGLTITRYEGGSLIDFDLALTEARAETASVSISGEWLVYVVGAPPFVNRDFLIRYAAGVPAGTMLLINKE